MLSTAGSTFALEKAREHVYERKMAYSLALCRSGISRRCYVPEQRTVRTSHDNITFEIQWDPATRDTSRNSLSPACVLLPKTLLSPWNYGASTILSIQIECLLWRLPAPFEAKRASVGELLAA